VVELPKPNVFSIDVARQQAADGSQVGQEEIEMLSPFQTQIYLLMLH